jgi:cytosine/adenosine deaminase-related metal-dependent hydrolase
MGLGDRIGSLKAGKAGDVVIWDGDPLEMESAPVAVWIDGIQQPIDNRQTKLRDRYATPTEGSLPKAYEW